MSPDYSKQLIYVSAFDYTEYALFKCTLRLFSCQKMLITSFPINYVFFNTFSNKLYATSMQGSYGKYLYRYEEDFNTFVPVPTVNEEASNIIFLTEEFAIYTDQQSITVASNINKFNATRKTTPKMVDPYALQYIFSFNQVINFDTYPYPYFFTDYHELLYKNSLYLFYFYICGMDIVENDQAFIPQMDLNNNFLHINDCQTRFLSERDAYLIPSIIGGAVAFILLMIGMMICCWRSKVCQPRVNRIKNRVNLLCWRKDDNSKIEAQSVSSDDSISKKEVSNYIYYTQGPSFMSEMYDKDPSSLTDINYARYNKSREQPSLSSSSSSEDLKFKPVFSTPSSSVSALSNNRVKFNDYKIEHFYEKEDVPKNSRIYNLDRDFSSSSSDSSSVHNYQNKIDRLDKKLSNYFANRGYVSNCDVSIYGSNSRNYLDILKNIENGEKVVESKITI